MPEDDRTIEHLLPKAKGGSNALENLALTPGNCNRLLGDKTLGEKHEMRRQVQSGTLPWD